MAPKRSTRALAAIAASSLLFAAGWTAFVARHARRQVRLFPAKSEHFRYDFVEAVLTARDPVLQESFAADSPRAVVTRGGVLVTTIGGRAEIVLTREAPDRWTGRWPVPWNAPPGEYRLALAGRPELSRRLRTTPFRIAARVPRPMPDGFVVATLESVAPLSEFSARGPDGRRGDWRVLLDWAQWLGADAFWMLAGQTPGPGPGEVWQPANRERLAEVAEECRRRGMKFGVYAMFSLTMSSKNRVPGYRYAEEIRDGAPAPTRAVSLTDPQRLEDAAALLAGLAATPGVDMVGIDYIRNALGGYELVDEFVAEMPGLPLPPEWPSLSRAERMTWLARKKIMRRDMRIVDAWQWWRARRAALVVKAITERLPRDTPFWAFTLTWDKGWHHGQDPVMMNDAGVDMDALMFYEADKAQYAQMLREWGAYLRRGDAQVVPGNIFDWGLHQKDPAGPAEFGRRLRAARDRVYGDGRARGYFYHDLARLVSGRRLGPWGTRGWAEEARRLSAELKAGAAR